MKTRHLPLFCALCAIAAGQVAFCQVESLFTVPPTYGVEVPAWPHVEDLALATVFYHAAHEAQALRAQSVDATAVTTGGIQVPSTAYNDGETIYVEEIVPAGFLNPVDTFATQMVPELSLLGGAPSPQVESAMRWPGDAQPYEQLRDYIQAYQTAIRYNTMQEIDDIYDSLAAEGEGADETETETEAETEAAPSFFVLRPQGSVDSESWEIYYALKIFGDLLYHSGCQSC